MGDIHGDMKKFRNCEIESATAVFSAADTYAKRGVFENLVVYPLEDLF